GGHSAKCRIPTSGHPPRPPNLPWRAGWRTGQCFHPAIPPNPLWRDGGMTPPGFTTIPPALATSLGDSAVKTRLPILLAVLALIAFGGLPGRSADKAEIAFPTFRMQEIETGLKVGYAVLLVDVNGDGKKDIVVVDTTRVVWYENPSWKRRTIIEGKTKPDNVCIAAYDIDGDGQLDFALGADWKGPPQTKSGGTLQWLKRGKTLDDPWTLYPIAEEPTVHRIRFADVLGEGKPQLINVPLMGREATAKENWMDGQP